jgi:hypothetical protein
MNTLDSLFQIIKDRDLFIIFFKESNYYKKKEEAKEFIEKNNEEILEALVNFINRFHLELEKYMNNESNKLLEFNKKASSWSIDTNVTPHHDNLTKSSPSPIKDPVTFVDFYRKNAYADNLKRLYIDAMLSS